MKPTIKHTHSAVCAIFITIALMIAAAGIVTMPTTANADTPQAGTWVQQSGKWWYKYTDGTYPANTQVTIKGSTYSFDAKGWMKTGWKLEDGSWYYYKSSGAMATGWQKVKGTWYYLNADGKMATGWQKVNNQWYYLKASGAMKTGWLQEGSDWCYLKSSGAMTTGWAKVKGSWYYLDTTSGKMKTGFYQVGNKTYYSNASGKMLTGWQKVNNKWYYFDNSGAAKTNTWISGTYWVGSDGAMATSGWVDNGNYYVDAAGKYVKNPSASQLATKPGHEHTWEAITEQVKVVDEPAHTVYTCACGLETTDNNELGEHMKQLTLSGDMGHGSYSSRVVKEKSHYETVVTGYKCSCGATKAA